MAARCGEAIRESARRFVRSSALYYGLITLSLIPLAIRIGLPEAGRSGLGVARGFEGALIFPLVLLTLMTWIVMPLVTRAIRAWLYPR